MSDELTSTTELHPVLELLNELAVQPSEATLTLLDYDPGETIEATFGRDRAMKLSQGFPLYVGHLPVGEMLERSVINDLKQCGYREEGWTTIGDSLLVSRDKLEKKYGPENVISIPELVIRGVPRTAGKKGLYFFIRPFEQEPQVLEIDQLPRESIFEASMRTLDDKLLPHEKGELVVMEYGERITREVYTIGILTDLNLLKFGTGLDQNGRVTGYKTIKLSDIQEYKSVERLG